MTEFMQEQIRNFLSEEFHIFFDDEQNNFELFSQRTAKIGKLFENENYINKFGKKENSPQDFYDDFLSLIKFRETKEKKSKLILISLPFKNHLNKNNLNFFINID